MASIKRSALVPYTPEQMFELVDNIQDYSRFLPWCSASDELSRDDDGPSWPSILGIDDFPLNPN